MKQRLLSLFIALLAIAAGAQAGNLPINATNFPDLNFRTYVRSNFNDPNKDGFLSDEKIINTSIIYIPDMDISDLKGIEFFTALGELNCSNNRLKALDVSKNTALENLWCINNQLTSLNVSKNTALKGLACYNNQLTTLNVSVNKVLETLSCNNNQLTSLNVSNNTALKGLECDNNQLTTLNVTKNAALTSLYCHNNRLTALDVSKNTALERLACYSNQLTNLNISNNPALKVLYCSDNQLTSLDISKNTELGYLDCSNNQLTSLDVSKNTKLVDVSCCGNKIRGEAMNTFIKGLHDRSETSSGILRISWNEASTGNEMTTSQVAAAKAKNWQVLMYDGKKWVDYPGVTPSTVTLNKSEVIVRKNKTVTLKATVYPSTLTDKSVKWKSSDKTIATVSSDGVVTGVKSGVVTITCTSNATGAKTTCKVTVGTITLDKKEVIIRKKKTVTLTPTVYPTTLEDKSVKWKTSDKSIATVSNTGVVKGVKSGVVTITCTSKATGLSATCKVTVGTITLNKSSVTVDQGKTVTLKPTVYPTTLEDQTVNWMSSDKSVATVTSAGKVKGVKAGVATITCTSNATGLSTTCTVTVPGIALDQSEVILRKKKTLTLTPIFYPETQEDKSVTWKSSDKSVATVSKDGVVTGVKSGVVTITCTSKATGAKATCQVTVGTITLNKSSVTLTKNQTVTLKPTVYPTTLEDKSVTWKSSKTSVAKVSSAGKVKGIAAGTATITCTAVATGVSTTCKVTVKAASARTLDGDDEELTDIEIVEMTPAVEEPFDVYDLRGHQVLHQVTSLDALPAGVYIVKGKKVLKK